MNSAAAFVCASSTVLAPSTTTCLKTWLRCGEGGKTFFVVFQPVACKFLSRRGQVKRNCEHVENVFGPFVKAGPDFGMPSHLSD